MTELKSELTLKNSADVTRLSEPWSSGVERQAHSLVFLEFPVRLRIGGVDLFAFRDGGRLNPYLNVPILSLAVGGLAALKRAKGSGRRAYILRENPAAILFKVHDHDVLVHCTITCDSAWTEYEELLKAWTEFGDEVRSLVMSRHPGIENRVDPDWFATGSVREAEDCGDQWFDDEEECLELARRKQRSK